MSPHRLHEWQRLMRLMGIDGPLSRPDISFDVQPQCNFLTVLPIEIRYLVFEQLLQDLHPPRAWPSIWRLPSGFYLLRLHRQRAFGHLLTLCKQIYLEASVLPFVCVPFRIWLFNAAWNSDITRGQQLLHDDGVLCLPRRLSVSVVLEEGSGLMMQLTRLRLVLEARKDAALVTRVILSLTAIGTQDRKRQIVRSLRPLMNGRNAIIRIDGLEEEMLDWVTEHFRDKDINYHVNVQPSALILDFTARSTSSSKLMSGWRGSIYRPAQLDE